MVTSLNLQLPPTHRPVPKQATEISTPPPTLQKITQRVIRKSKYASKRYIQKLTILCNSDTNTDPINSNAFKPLHPSGRDPQYPNLMCMGSQFDGIGDKIDTTDINTLI